MKQILGFFVSFLLFSSARSQTADAIVNRYVEWIGGEAAWQQVRSLSDTGTYNYGGMEFPFRSYAVRPNLYKFKVPFNGKYYEQAFDGTRGWKIDAFNGETQKTGLSGKAALAMLNEADVELEPPFLHYKAKGHSIELDGTDTLNGMTCPRIKLRKKTGETETYLFSPADGSIVEKTALSKNAELKNSLLHTYYSDYRTVGKIRVPFVSVSKSNGDMILTITVKSVQLNPAVPKTAFQL